MTDVSPERTLNLSSFLPDTPHRTFGSGEIMQLESAEKTDEANANLYHTLREREWHFRVYRKENIPAWYGSLRHAFVLPIVAIAENGWLLDDGIFAALFEKYPRLGKHGWDADWTDMQGIFLAEGTAFKRGYTSGTLRNIDIAPLVCAVLGIPVQEKSDGDLRKIGFLINEPHAKP
jgi:ectonucleotide pyrophosphatase/phosphodiesterase family protein 5